MCMYVYVEYMGGQFWTTALSIVETIGTQQLSCIERCP